MVFGVVPELFMISGVFQTRSTARQPQHTGEPCHCVSDQSWACHGALQGQMQPLQRAAGVVEPALGAAAGLGRWFVVGVAVLLNAGVFQ